MGKRRDKTKNNLERTKFKRIRVIYSSEDETNYDDDGPSNIRRQRPRVDSRSRSRSPIIMTVHRDGPPRGSRPRRPSPQRAASSPRSRSRSRSRGETGAGADQSGASPSTPPAPPQADPVPSTSTEMELDEDTLLLLGDAPKDDTPLGPPVHKDIANRWQEILAKGLNKEIKEKITKEHMVPSNCDLLLAPELNPEAKAALSDVFIKRDMSIMNKQKQLAVALSALATVTQLIISNETSKQKLLKPLSDACRILCDSHHRETTTRRNFVVSSINTTLKDTLNEAERGKYLFGDNVGEKLKVAKNIQRSGEALKPPQKNVFTKSNFALKRGRLNFQQNQRRSNNRPAGAGDSARAARPTQRPAPRPAAGPSRARKPSDRSPPPPRRTYRR